VPQKPRARSTSRSGLGTSEPCSGPGHLSNARRCSVCSSRSFAL
jgi:hypothetical protein